MNTAPQSAVFPEARQFLRSHNQITPKKTTSDPTRPKTGLTVAKTEPNLTRYFISGSTAKARAEGGAANARIVAAVLLVRTITQWWHEDIAGNAIVFLFAGG